MGGLSEYFNKRNIHEKILFLIVLNEFVKYDIYTIIRTKKTSDCIIKKSYVLKKLVTVL